MKKILSILILTVVISLFSFTDVLAQRPDLSQQVMGQLDAGAGAAEFGVAKDPRQIAGEAIKVFLGLLGMFFIVLVVMSGYWLVTSRGEEAKITKAKDTMRRAVIGIIIVLLSYSITIFITSGIQKAVRTDGNSAQTSQ
jgi:hypothetical protein